MGRTSNAKERILASAQRLFYARSYETVSVQNICEDAKVKKGSFYHYFRSKAALTLTVSEQFTEQARESLLVEVFNPIIPPLQRIESLFQWAYRFQKKSKTDCGKVLGCLNLNLCTELATQNSALREHISQVFSNSIDAIQSCLDEAINNGDLKICDSKERAETIFAYLQGALSLAKAQNDPEIIQRLGKAIPLFFESVYNETKKSPTSINKEKNNEIGK